MFKPGRWWSEKNKLKVIFKLHFHASQVTQSGGDGLMISVIPADTGKPSVKSDKAAVIDRNCFWENPVCEIVKFNQDPKSGKIYERVYYFVVGTGSSSKSGVVGEASIDFSNYAEATKVSSVSLPLKNSQSEAILHVSIQRVQETMDQRETEETENSNVYSKDHILSSPLGNRETDGTTRNDSIEDAPSDKTVSQAENNAKQHESSVSDVTLSSSGSSSGIEIPSLNPQGPKSDALSPIYKEHQRSWEWLENSALEDSADDSSSTAIETEAANIVIEKLKADVAALSRQAETSELELQALRKHVLKESKKGQDLWREVVFLKEERDGLKEECEQLKAFRKHTKTNSLFGGVDSEAIVEELRQELNHVNELNANLRIQLQKTHESNSELILAVRDLDDMLDQKNRELSLSNPSGRSLGNDMDEMSREKEPTSLADDEDDDDDDEEQKALEDLVKEHSEPKESFILEQQIMDLRSELEMYKRDKDELEIQMEQLALDYEIVKQANHEMSYKLEQSEIQEQLKMQYECSSSDATPHELESRLENLENEVKTRSKEYEDSMVTISELQAHVKSLEEALEKQTRGFEADMEALARSKVEQEQRAVTAEETLKKLRWRNANAAERLQDEFRKLSMQMASTFEANEKVATKALAEANELRLQKSHLEEMLRKASEEHQSVEGHYETRLHELTSQMILMTNQIEQMQSEIEDKAVQLEYQKKHAEDEILTLRDEVETLDAKNRILLEDMEGKEAWKHALDKTRFSVKEMELLVEQGNDEKIELEGRVLLMKTQAEELHKELNKMRSLVKEKEWTAGSLQSELDSLKAQCTKLKDAQLENEAEKEKLRKHELQLRSDLKKREDAFNSMEKKMKDGSGRATTIEAVKTTSKTSKPLLRGSKEVTSLKERVKFLEGQIKLKDTAFKTSANAFLEKENDLRYQIEELEGRWEVNKSSSHLCGEQIQKPAAAVVEEKAPNCQAILSIKSNDTSDIRKDSTANTADVEELKNETALLNERNKSMEEDLKEMQERYLDISLKFAEVEGERQQLIMKLRNLTNANYKIS